MSTAALSAATPRAHSFDRPIAFWLLACCAMIFCMVVIGGITRLTESGLSITEWQPVTGIVPPLSEAQWRTEFQRYQEIPQYRAIHPDMTLAGFKSIFFWEYLHRLWGRLIGFVFAVPFAWFLLRGQISRRLAPKLLGLFVLGGLQGALGWYMVESGLEHRIEVSQYRLAAHLLTAVVIYVAILWVALGLLSPTSGEASGRATPLRRCLSVLILLLLVTLGAGAFVAGLRAGYIYNTFPLMGGSFAPSEYWQLAPWWRNWFENAAAAQFDHRLLAEATWLFVAAIWLYGLRPGLSRGVRLRLHLLFAAACLQLGLGIATLLLVVPLPVAVSHQAGALLLVTAAVVARHALRRPPRLDAPARAAV